MLERIKQSCLRGRISERVIAELLEEAELPEEVELAERLNAELFERHNCVREFKQKYLKRQICLRE